MEFLVIDDDKTFREATCLLIESEGHCAEATCSGVLGLKELDEGSYNSVLLDLHLGRENGLDILDQILQQQPRLPVILFTAQGTINNAVEAMRRGAVDFLEKPFTGEQFGLVLARVERIHQLNQTIERLEQAVKDSNAQSPEILLQSNMARVNEVMETVRQAAKTAATLLILGETGSGKSVLARASHVESHLPDTPFITVGCPSSSKELLESDLFGHVASSSTGARQSHWGKVKAAAGGTLFLDEIGDLPMEIQPKLLRLLQERTYERVGENITRRADVRIVAATSHDLEQHVADGVFHGDLYSQLRVTSVNLPPLRDRPGDLAVFAEHYRRHFAHRCGRRLEGFTPPAMAGIRAYSWPGNLRELRNAIERGVIIAKGNHIDLPDLPIPLREPAIPDVDGRESLPQVGGMVSMERLEEAHLRKVMERTSNLAQAAHVLGIDQATLYRKRKKFGLE